jgi:AraC-like DNA-binding protein
MAAREGETPLVFTTPDFRALARPGITLTRHVVAAFDCPAPTAAPRIEGITLHAMCAGAEILRIGGRQLRLDGSSFIVVDGTRVDASHYAGAGLLHPVTVGFRAGAVAACLAGAAGDDDGTAPSTEAGFLETLHDRRGDVAHHLSSIDRHAREQRGDPLWWEERITLLLGAALAADRSIRARAAAMPARKPATRRELLRRVTLAADYIRSMYEQPIALADIAAAARLSRFHLVRLFQRAYGVTPHAYLTQKRVAAALRLVARTELGLDDIAARSGFGSRSSLFRHLRREHGSGAAALRARQEETCSSSV